MTQEKPDYMLDVFGQLLTALGWQGGTIHDALKQVKLDRELARDFGSLVEAIPPQVHGPDCGELGDVGPICRCSVANWLGVRKILLEKWRRGIR